MLVPSLLIAGDFPANAAPAPDNGPTGGGTTVVLPEPEGIRFSQVSAGGSHSVAIGLDGNTYAWGWNQFGQVGDGTTTDRVSPTEVSTPEGAIFTSVSAGQNHSLAIASNGKTYAWGLNDRGQLGDGSQDDRSTPVEVATPPGVTFISVSAGSQGHSLAIGSDGKAYSWGSNQQGQLGDGTSTDRWAPVEIDSPQGVSFVSVAAGYQHSLALGSDGKAYGWGNNISGQLGDGTTDSRTAPVEVASPGGIVFTTVSAGYGSSLAIGSNGEAYSWGSNSFGQLGDETQVNRTLPVAVSMPDAVSVADVSAGSNHSLAVSDDGLVYAWGYNSNGELGDMTNSSRPLPLETAIPSGETVLSVSGGFSHSIALDANGVAFAWGANFRGKLGDGTTDSRLSAVQVKVPTLVTGVTFAGVPGTNLVDNGDGTWRVDTPPNPAGVVDVVVAWTRNGVVQEPLQYADGFTYWDEAMSPTITNPENQTVAPGAEAVFEVGVTGSPAPSVTWYVSRDGGSTWGEIDENADETVSSAGRVLSVIGTEGNNGFQYRAKAVNEVGSAYSEPALLVVSSEASPGPEVPTEIENVAPGGSSGPNVSKEATQDSGNALAATGASSSFSSIVTSLVVLAIGAVLLFATRVTKARRVS